MKEPAYVLKKEPARVLMTALQAALQSELRAGRRETCPIGAIEAREDNASIDTVNAREWP
jgi:hypothetical protein